MSSELKSNEESDVDQQVTFTSPA